MKHCLFRFVILLALCGILQACVFVVGAAAGAAAIAVVYDHRSIRLTLKDTQIGNTISRKIAANAALRDGSHIEVTVFNKVILLTGETPQSAARAQAEEIAKSLFPGLRIYNQITIEGPTSSLTRTSDSWITTKIRGLMLADETLKSSMIKVITENGVVYVMGSVTRAQAEKAVLISRQVAGVQKVIKVFQYND